jgi:hypothetical protein
MYTDFRLTQAADQVRASWAQARAQALDEGRPYRFAVVPNKSNFRVAPDTSDYWSGGNPPTPADPNNPPLVISEAIPKGISFTMGDAGGNAPDGNNDTVLPPESVNSGSWQNVVSFMPDGTASDDIRITLQAKGGQALVIRLRALTGAVTVKPMSPDDGRRSTQGNNP